MGRLLVRGLDDTVIEILKKRASSNGRTVEAEHRMILETAARTTARSIAPAAERFARQIVNSGQDSTAMIREQRDGVVGSE